MRGDQLARQWRILRHIESSVRGLTVVELAELEGIGIRTAYRDLESLQDAGFPLYYEKVDRVNRWAFVDTYKFQVPQPFTMTELMSLHLYSDLIRIFKGIAFYDSLESLFKKVKSTLPPQAIQYIKKVQSTFSVGIKPYKEYGRFQEIISQVNQAVSTSYSLEIAYQPLRTSKDILRKVDPYKIWFFEGTIYLIAYCHLRNEVRMFVVDRIKLVRSTEQKFNLPENFSLDKFMKHSFKVMHDELHTVRIRISPEWSRWVGERIWHESQRTKTLDDGSLVLNFRVAGLDEIKMWVMSLGPEAIVVEPIELIEIVKESISETMLLYEGKSPKLIDTKK